MYVLNRALLPDEASAITACWASGRGLRRTKVGHPVELRACREGSGAALSHIASDAGLADGPLPLAAEIPPLPCRPVGCLLTCCEAEGVAACARSHGKLTFPADICLRRAFVRVNVCECVVWNSRGRGCVNDRERAPPWRGDWAAGTLGNSLAWAPPPPR
jgi:hypothetical protein